MTRALVVVLALAAPAQARPVRGLVFDDANGDGKPTAGERGVAAAVVALGVEQFVTTDGQGQFTLDVPDDSKALAWVRVPDGFTPGPVWARVGAGDVELALHRLPAPYRGAITFVVAADLHMTIAQPFWAELGAAATAATAIDPPPAFFTILGDVTSGNQDAQFDLVDAQLAGLGVPYVPVPGNHDWYDDGETWFRRYGPDNYSFDIDRVHFVVWNMAMSADDVSRYLGAELARVPPDMTIVALTHAPPVPAILDALHRLGVDYVLTAHTHTNRVVDHGGLVELTTEPLLMGGLDFTPAGYRVVTIDGGRLAAYHHATVEPRASIQAPARGRCAGDTVLVAAELDGGAATVTARIDCASPIELAYAGGWMWRARLPELAPGSHALAVEARSPAGAHASASTTFVVCDAPATWPAGGGDTPQLGGTRPTRWPQLGGTAHPGPARWPQLGGSATHAGATARAIAPPLVARWTTAVGGHVLQAPPVVSGDTVFVSVTDLGRGDSGGVVALDLATGAIRWRVATPIPVRGGPVVVAGADGPGSGHAGADGSRGAGDHPTTPPAKAGAPARSADEPRRTVATSQAARDGSQPAGDARQPPLADGRDASRDGVASTPARAVDGRHAPVADGRAAVASVPQVGGSVAGTDAIVAVGELDGTLLGLDARSGAERWRYELGAGLVPEAASTFASPAVDAGDVLLGNQRHLAVLDGATGAVRWTADPVPTGTYSQSLAAVAVGDGVVVGVFHRELGGVAAWDRLTGALLWRLEGEQALAINATPVIADRVVYLVNGLTEVIALDVATGAELWQTKLDPDGFDWGNATAGAPAIAHGIVVVPTLYRDLVALDAATGSELWRLAGTPGPLRTTHYRGAHEAGFAAAPVLTGDVVWAADTAGRLTAVNLYTGDVLWHAELGAPVLAGLAVAGDHLVVASYDGTVRLLGPPDFLPLSSPAPVCEPPPPSGCCDAGPASPLPALAMLVLFRRRGRARAT